MSPNPIPPLNSAVYLHAIRLPLFAQFENPVKYGLSGIYLSIFVCHGNVWSRLLNAFFFCEVDRTVNVKIETPDNERLGAWLVLPNVHMNITNPISRQQVPPSELDIHTSLSTHPTILYFHGNAATRAMSQRVRYYTTYAHAFNANVLAIDYRGFGDSSGTPSKEGLVVDARATLDWVVEKGAKVENVLIVGLSLGTGVASALGADLEREGSYQYNLSVRWV